ncbi:MAG: 4'-phosphopantetheinyl transferase superfamily protein [Bacteroides sp.]|nr:4'-phosphopantetheinyl transferase superfamily protein [Bacteroides sp.]
MSLFQLHKIGDSSVLGIWKMDESHDELQAKYAGTPLGEEAARRFKSPRRWQEWLSVRMLLSVMTDEPKEIRYLPSGKPYLADDSRFISISHTDGYAAVILGQTPVGIDIEHFGLRVHKVADRFMNADFPLDAHVGDEATWLLLLNWSAKEVMYKCMDEEEVDFVEHLHIRPFSLQEAGIIEAYETKTSRRKHFLIHYQTHPDFVLTWWEEARV